MNATDISIFAGLLVLILSKFGVPVANNDVVTVLSAVATIWGTTAKYFQHKTVVAQLAAANLASVK